MAGQRGTHGPNLGLLGSELTAATPEKWKDGVLEQASGQETNGQGIKKELLRRIAMNLNAI